jgi:hypothetical protein
MSQQNGGFPGEQQGQGSPTSATPHVFPFGTPQSPEQQPWQGQSQQGQPQQGQQWQEQGQQPGYADPQGQGRPQNVWPGQPQGAPGGFGSGPQFSAQSQGGTPPQQWGGEPGQQWGAPTGSQPEQPYQQPQGQQQAQQPYEQQGQWPQPDAQPQGSQPQFSGILDPHTGEIHPVPDLSGLDATDALLVVVSGPDAGAQILLDTDVVTVGRSPNADIFLDDVTVSRKHAEFVRTPSGFTLRDTGSLNGTYVGRQLIDSIELQNGADVQIGKFRMIFQQRPRTS